MAIVFKLDDKGGFTVGETDSRITAYAYPSSVNAIAAMRKGANLQRLAERIMKGELRSKYIASYDDRNWARLNKIEIPI